MILIVVGDETESFAITSPVSPLKKVGRSLCLSGPDGRAGNRSWRKGQLGMGRTLMERDEIDFKRSPGCGESGGGEWNTLECHVLDGRNHRLPEMGVLEMNRALEGKTQKREKFRSNLKLLNVGEKG